jgi:uncharacterized protein Yka (UPF0111/DUF47 family)
MLDSQADTTLRGMVALDQWIAGGCNGRCQQVRDLEKEADEIKLELEREIVESFITPIDREDLYDLSAKLDEVINAGKTIAREVEAMEVHSQNSFLVEMAATLVEGTRCVVQSFNHLDTNLVEAANQAFLARKSETRFSKIYRQAMQHLFTSDDFKIVLKTQEIYSCMSLGARRIDEIGEKLSHVIVKIS